MVAEKNGLFAKTHYKSEVDGLIREISHTDGAIIISVDSGNDLISMSPLVGEVEEVTKKEVKIKISKSHNYEAKTMEGEGGGRVLYVKSEHDLMSEEEVDGAIVCTESLTSYNQMKYEALGAAGFIVQKSLSEETPIPFAVVKTIQDFETLQKTASPSCFLRKDSGTIVCYG